MQTGYGKMGPGFQFGELKEGSLEEKSHTYTEKGRIHKWELEVRVCSRELYMQRGIGLRGASTQERNQKPFLLEFEAVNDESGS